jgi:hypothetical protein
MKTFIGSGTMATGSRGGGGGLELPLLLPQAGMITAARTSPKYLKVPP